MKKKINILFPIFFITFFYCCTNIKTENIEPTFQVEDNLSVEKYINLAYSLMNKGNYKESIDVYKKALKISPNNAAIYDSICVVHNTQTDFQDAIIAGEKAMSINPQLHNNLYYSYNGAEEWEKMEEICQKELKINSKNNVAINNLNYIHAKIQEKKVSKLRTIIIIVFMIIVFFFSLFKNRQSIVNLNLFETVLISSFVTYLVYLIFYHYSSYVWSFNLKIPSEELQWTMKSFMFNRDGIEGYVLYSLMFVIIILSYSFTQLIILIKNKIYAISISIILLFYSSIFFIDIGFNPPMMSISSFNINLILISCVILAIIFLNLIYTKLPNTLYWLIIILFLIPICFISTSSISIWDYSFIFMPAMRMNDGYPLSEIYFQYDLFLSLLAAVWMKLHIDVKLFQILGQLSFFLFFIGILFFSKQFFFNKKLSIFIFISLIITRYYSIDHEPTAYLQVTPLRLDLWLILLLLSYFKGIYHWSVGLFLGILLVIHKNFGLIYLISYYEVVFTLFCIAFFQLIFDKRFNLISVKSLILKEFSKNIKNALLIIIFLIISIFLFKGFIPESAVLYQKVGIGMMRISTKSFYWYIPILFSLVFSLLLKYRTILAPNYLSTGLFILFLAIGNSIYFFGRSHEHNIINISGLLILTLFLLFDLLDCYQNFKPLPTGLSLKKIFVSSAPILFIIASTYFFSERISNKINTQYKNFQKHQTIYPLNEIPHHSIFSTINQLTNDSKNVYFLQYVTDFQYYYYGKYSPQGYYNPCVSWVIKKDFANFLQTLLDRHYYIITTYCFQMEDILPLIKYNKVLTKGFYTAISEEKVTLLLPIDKRAIEHIGIACKLNNNGIYRSPIKLSEEFSIEMIIKSDSILMNDAKIISNYSNIFGPRGFKIHRNGENKNQFVFTYGNGKYLIPNVVFKLNEYQWNYLTIVVNKNAIKIFNNGQLLHTEKRLFPIKNNDAPLIIGNNIGEKNFFNGLIKEVKITNDTISQENIIHNFNIIKLKI